MIGNDSNGVVVAAAMKGTGRGGFWGRGLAARALQVAVVVAVTSSVPAAWSANKGAPASVTAASTPNLHVNKVAAGSASFLNSGSLTTVTTGSARTIINYQYLSVPAGTTLDFVQPSVKSRVMNRIEGNVPSAIDGTLKSNGIVYLINPAGVIFGNGAVVSVGKFFAAAAHMSDADFMAGRNHFTDGSGRVANYGTITAQEVHLVGAQVANFGEIVAPSSSTGGGIVTMTAGKDVYIGESNSVTDQPHVLVKVSGDTSSVGSGTGVTNSGSITAGQIRLGAGDLYAAGIYSGGVLTGREITLDSGASTNVVAGTIDASSVTGKGGTVQILGDKVGITSGAVTASGATGGGTVLVGGAAHGAGGVQVATDTVISTGVTVSADGTGSKADGGTVVVFSSAWTKVEGQISATGGVGGSGGFVETSSHNLLSVSTAPSVGTGGTWLMDPTDVTIDSVANANETPTTASGTTTFDPSGDTATVSALAITTALDAGTNVVINTTSSAATAGILGNITFNTPLVVVTTVGTPTLTLNASGNIVVPVGDGIATTGLVPLAVNFNAGGTTTINDNISTNGGTFTSSGAGFTLAAGNISTGGGDVILKQTGADVSITGNVTTGSGTFWSTGANFTNSGAISSTNAINILHTGNVSLGGDVDASGTGSLSIAGVSVVQTAGTVTAGTAAIQTSGDDGSVGTFAVKLDDANAIGTLAINSTGTGANVEVTTGGATGIGSAAALTGVPTGLPAFGAVTGITTAGGNLTVTTGGATTVSSAIGTSNGTVTIGAGGTLGVSSTIDSGNGTIGLTAAGNITVGGAISAGTGNATLTASTGDINGVASNAITAANVSLTATAGGVGIGHVVTVTSGSAVSITTGGTDAAGDASFAFTGVGHTGDITLADTAASKVGLTYTITAGSFVVNSNFGLGNASLDVTTNGGGITATGSNVLTADTLTLTSNGTGIGSVSHPLAFADSTSASFTGSGDIYVSGNLDKPVTFTTDATPRTIGVIGGAVTVGTNLAAGANNTLIIDGTTSLTLSAGKTVSGATVYLTSAGDVTVTGNVTATGTAYLLGNTVTGGGVVSGTSVGAEATGILTGVSVNLSNVSAGTVAASGPLTLGGTVTIGAMGDVTVGSVGALSPTGFTGFAAVSGVKGNGNNVSVTAAGNVTLANDVDGGLLGNATVNANGTASNILETGGVVKGANIALVATGGIGANGTPLQIGTLGGIALTTSGANQSGSVYVQINNALTLGSLTVTTDAATVQTVSIAELATLSLTGSVSFGTDDVGLVGTNLSLSSGQTITAGNVTLSATSGNLSIDGTVTGGTGGLVTLTAAGGDLAITGNVTSGTGGTINISTTAGNISQTGGTISTSGGTVTVNAVGGTLTVSGTAITGGTGNVSLAGATGVSQTAGAVTATGGNLSVSAGNGTIALSGGSMSVGAGNLSITASNGSIAQTAGTIGAAGGTLTVSATGGNVSLGGTTSAAGGAVSVTSGADVSGGNITASTLTVNANTTISLSGNSVGTIAAVANGTATFTNSGGVTIGKIGSITGVSSNGHDITVQTTGGDIAVNQPVAAGAGNATVHAAGNVTANANGSVTGNVVTLTADAGDLGNTTAALHSTSSDLVLSGNNIYVVESNAFATTGATRLAITSPNTGNTLDLTAPSINVTTTLGSSNNDLVLTTSGTGAVTTSGSGSLVGASITVDSAAGIGSAGTGLSVAPGATTTLDLTATGAGIFVNSTTAVDLGLTTVSDSGQPVEITAPALSTSADFTAGTSTLKLTSSGGLDLTHTITAANITVITDDVTTGTGTFTAAGGTVTVLPFTAGRAINLSSTGIGGDLNIGEAVLQNTTASNVVIGNGSTTSTMVIGPLDLSAAVYNFSLHTSGQYNFQGTLTLQNNKTFTLDGASSIVNNAAVTDIVIGGTNGTLVISNIAGSIGSSASPLTTQLAKLGGLTGTGAFNILNTGNLSVTGTVNAGTTGANNSIGAHSPLTISAPVTAVGNLSLIAGDNAAAPGDFLSITNNVQATGDILLQAGDGVGITAGIVSTPGTVTVVANHEDSLADLGLGSIVESGAAGIQASLVDAHATVGIQLTGSNNQFGSLSAQNVTGSNAAAGDILVSNTGAAGQALALGTITNQGGNISITASGAVTQTGVITTSGGTLTVQTRNALGAPITLTNGNTLGGGKATLQTLDASGGSTVSANVSFTTSGAMHLQQIQSGANVTLNATTIDQDGLDTVGIQAATLKVTSAGTTSLTNSHNHYTTLNVTDSSTATLQYTTAASGDLTISGLTQTAGGTANVTNSAGGIGSTANLDVLNLNVSAAGNISLASTSNRLSNVTASTTAGNVTIDQGNSRPVTFSGISVTGGGATTLVSSSDVTLTGTIAAGTGLSVTATTAGGTYNESSATITSSGAVGIVADHVAISGSSLTASGQEVTIKPLTLTETIAINGADTAGQLGLLNGELATISAGRLTLGAYVAPGDPGNQTGNVVASGAFNLPINTRIITTGNVDLSGVAITSTNAGSQGLEVDHGGTLAIGTATIDGGFSEFGASGSGSGGVVSLSGALTTTDHAVNFLSSVVLTADTTIDTSGATGADISFANTTSAVAGGHNLTLKAQGGNVTFASAAGGGGNALGFVTVGSGAGVTFQAVNASGENINDSGVLTLNGTQTLGAAGFVQSNATNVALNADIVTSSGPITLNSLTTLSGATRTLDTTAATTSSGADITLNGVVNGGSTNFTLTAGTGNVAVNAPITTLGIFTSTGNNFSNGNATNQTAVISAGGIEILHNITTGQVEIWSNLNSPGFNVVTQGANVTLEHGATITGDQVDQPAGVGVFINDAIFAPSGYTSSGDTPYTITVTGSITTNGANATINYPLGLVTIDGPINTHGGSGDGVLVINGLGIMSGTTGTITAGVVTLNGEGHDVTLGGAVTGTGLLTSTGANFTNTATVSVNGANLTHTGLVSINANFTGNGSNVSISGVGILSNVSGTLGGNAITLAGGTGNVTLGGALSGSGLLTVTGANFLNTANVTAVGANISMPTGAVNFNAPIQAGTGDLLVTSATVTSNANGTIGGANITFNETGAVSLGATVTGTGDLVSNGTTFSGIDISAATVTLNHTGLVTFNGNVTAGGGAGTVQVTGAGLTQTAGIVDSGTLTLLGTGTFTLTDANTVGTLSADITGPLTYVNADDLIVGTAGSGPTVGITTHGGALSLTVTTGDLTVSSPINTGAGAITFLTSAGGEHVNANVTTTSTFSSNGTAFTSNATITANGITLTQTGLVDLNGAIEGGASPVNITGVGITSTSNGTIDSGTLTLTAGTGDTSLAGTINATGLFTTTGANFTNTASITSAGANITHTGSASIDGALIDGANAVLVDAFGITSDANGTIQGGTITLTAHTGDETLSGEITGSGLFSSTGANFTNNANITSAGANLTQTGLVDLNGALEDGNNAVNITGVGIQSTTAGTIDGGTITLAAGTGDTTLNGGITGSGLFTSTGGAFTNNASVTTAGATITSTGAVNIDGGLFDTTNPIFITGIGITSDANGTMQAGNVTLVGQTGDVSLAGAITATGFFQSTGANFTNTASITSAGANVTHTGPILIDGALNDGSSDVLLHGPGITSTVNGVITAGNVTLTAGSSDVSLAGDIHATGLLLSTGANFTNTGNLTSAGANITHTGSALIDGALNDGGSPVLIDAVGITSTANGTMTTGALTLTAHSGDISLAGVINASGLFTSTGAAFINTAAITSVGATITQTGSVQIHGPLDATGHPVNITGLGISSNTVGTIAGSTITLTGGVGDVNLAGNVNGTGLFTSTGAAFTNTGSITSAGANITHTGAVNIDGALIDGSSNININGAGITSNGNGTMDGGAITLTGNAGDVTLAGTIHGSGLFTSTGAAFTNTASITSAGANITHTSAANIDGALIDGTNPIFINAIGIASDANGTMQAGNITLTAHSGNVSLAGTITATGFFQSTGANFTNTANITSAGANITHTGAALIDGALLDGGNAILIDAVGITSTTRGSMTAGPVTLTAHAGDVSLAGTIDASGLFTSTGNNFTNTASITSAGANITHTGSATVDGALIDGSSAINISAFGISSNANGTMNAGPITLTAHTGDVSLAGTINATGLFTSTGVGFLNTASITSAGANLTHTGLVQIQGALIDGSNAINIIGSGIHSTVAGTMTAGPITLTGGSGDVLLAGNINASGLFTSTGAAFTNTGSITSAGANITHSGAVNIDGALADGTHAITITGAGISSNASGTMNAGPITLTGGSGNVNLAGVITASGLFTSTGAAFTNTASITSAGALLTHTGAVNIDGALNDGANAVTITGHGIASNASGPITAGNITLTAGSGDVSLAGTVAGSGFFTSTGNGFLNTATITVAGANLTHTGFVQIHNAFDSTGNPVTITGQGIDSNTAGTIHATTLALNSLGGDATLSGNIVATGAFTSTGVGFTNNGTISAVGITLTHSGAVTINNTMDAHTGAISITGAASINDPSSTLTGVGVTLHAGGFIAVGNTINAGTGPALLTSDGSSVTDTGDILASLATITAATNATASNITTTNGNISINAPAGITLRGNLLAGTANVLVNGPATLANDVTVVGSTATFVSSIAGAGKALVINASGLTFIGGDVGSAGAPLASILTDAPGTTTLHGSAYATGNLFILDPLTLTADSNISGSTVKFGGTIVGGGVSLTVTAPTLSDFAGSIGNGTGNVLTSFSVSGGTATFHGASITTTGSQTFNAPVVLEQNLVATGTAFTFGSTIDSLGTPAGLTITGNGPLVLSGDIGTNNILGSFISTGSTGTDIAHPITTTGDISIAGPITIGATLKSTGGNVALPGAVQLTGNTNVTANGLGGITFGLGGITGAHNLTFTSNGIGSKTAVGAIGTGTNGRVGNVTFNSGGVVALGGNIFAQNVKFAYRDGGAAPTFNPTIATVFYAKGDLIINVNGFDMQQNESLSVFAAPTNFQSIYGTPTGIGNLSIISNNHPVTVGDLSAQGTLTINTGDVHQLINIRARPGVQVSLAEGGTLNSPAVGITSGLTTPNALILKGTLSIIPSAGSSNQVFFSSGAATVDIANTISLQLGDVTKILDFNRTTSITGKAFLGSDGTIVLTQVATGLGLPPQNQVNVVPRDIQTLQPERAAAISGALKDALQEIGIYARDVRTDELIEYLVGTALYDDVPYKLDPTPQDMKVAANRLPYAPVLPTVDAYRALFLKPELDKDGKPVLDDKGKPKMVVQNTIILNTFGQTWLAYKMAMKDKATPDGYRGWLEANASANQKNESALGYLDQLRDLLLQVRSLGLTSTEYDVSKKVLLSKVRPPNIKEQDFFTAVMGPTTRARTMTAMRNGDRHPGRG